MTESVNGAFQTVKKWGPTAAIAGAAAAGVINFDLPPWAIEMAKLWGPGFLMVLGVFAGIARYVPKNVVGEFVQAQKDQAVAMARIGDQLQVIAGQSGKLDEIAARLEEWGITQDIMGERLKKIEGHLVYGKRDDNPQS